MFLSGGTLEGRKGAAQVCRGVHRGPPGARVRRRQAPPATAPGASLPASVLPTQPTGLWAFPRPEPPHRGLGTPEPAGLPGPGGYLVVRGLLQHLRAQVGAELELAAPKVAPGQEQRFHLGAHGCRARPGLDHGRARGGRGPGGRGPGRAGPGSGQRPALPGNSATGA